MEKNAYLKIFASAAFTFAFLAITPQFAHAAKLYFSPSSGSHAVGTVFQVSVYASSADQAMNAASGIVTFPQDKLEIASLSKTGSIFSLWAQEPVFSNSEGRINFEGIVLNPGFTGAIGKIVSINLRAKTVGEARLVFSSGSALANDGKGTNILSGLGDAVFSLGGVAPATVPEATAPGEIDTLSAPTIFSPTHPDPDRWYADNNPKFMWALPRDATAVRLLVERTPAAVPTVTYIPAISSRELDKLENGIWYFSVRLRNDAGWGAISRFRFQIDTEPPNVFNITQVQSSNFFSARASFLFNAEDKTSGVEHYEIQIDDGDTILWRDDGTHQYETPLVGTGAHTITAKAIDRAGNATVRSATFAAPAIFIIGTRIIGFLAVAVPVVALVLVLLFILWHGWHQISLMKGKLKKEVNEAESALHRAFDSLKEDVREHIRRLKKPEPGGSSRKRRKKR